MSDPDRMAHVMDRLAFHRGEQHHLGRSLCTTAAEVVELPGAAIVLVNGAGTIYAVGVCGAIMAVVEELQLVHGEGPCIEAHRRGAPVHEPDLAARPERWLGFAQPAVEAGARAVFGFPLRIGTAGIGALDLCADRAGELTESQTRDALVLAEVATVTILGAHPGRAPGELSWDLVDESAHQLVVHQATGVVAVQLGGDVVDALARLRAEAFSSGRPLADVARAVVAGTLRLEP